MTREYPRGKGVEAEITFLDGPAGAPLVRKAYRPEVPCVAWLNRHLARWYDPALGMPVAQHEHAALALLAPLGFAPAPVRLEPGAVVMAWAGVPLGADAGIPPRAYRDQCREILAAFRRLGFRHNDLIPRNVLVRDGRVMIVDFTLAEFGPVSIAPELPDPRWARPGRDERLLDHYRELRHPLLGRAVTLLRAAGRPRAAGAASPAAGA